MVAVMYAEPCICDATLDAKFTLKELQVVLDKAKCGKAPGLNRVPYEFFKNASPKFMIRLLDLFNKIYDSGDIPPNFKDALIFPLFKKGDSKDVKNYRAISFIDVEAKLFSGLLLNRFVFG